MPSPTSEPVAASHADRPVGRLEWIDAEPMEVAGGTIRVARGLKDQSNHASGLRRDAGADPGPRKALLAALRLHNYLLVDGFIEREVGRLIRIHYRPGSAFLEVGCGDMALNRFLPASSWYNAFDLSLSELNLARLFAERRNANVALASAKSIPLESGQVDCLASTECLEHIPGVEEAVKEMRRVCRTGAKAIITIPNNFGTKYRVKGPHPEHVNDWTFAGFRDFMAANGFRMLQGFMRGWWIPFPAAVTRTSYQLPLTGRMEKDNTNFFYVFEAV